MMETGVNHGLPGLYQTISDIYEQLNEPDSVQYYLSRKIEVEREFLTSTLGHPNRPPKTSHRKVGQLIYALV